MTLRQPLNADRFLKSHVPAAREVKKIPLRDATAIFTNTDNPYFAFRMRDGSTHFEKKHVEHYLADLAIHLDGIKQILTFHMISEDEYVRQQLGITGQKAEEELVMGRTVAKLRFDVEPFLKQYESQAQFLDEQVAKKYGFDFVDAKQTLNALVDELKASRANQPVKWRIIVGAPSFLKEVSNVYQRFSQFFAEIDAEFDSLDNLQPFADSIRKTGERLERAIGTKYTYKAETASARKHIGIGI